MIISKIWFFNLPDIDQGIQKHVIQKKRTVLSVFEKSYAEKKKFNISISRTTLYTQKNKFCRQNFFSKKCLFEDENQFAVEKKKEEFLVAISIF